MGVVNVTPDSFSDGGQFADASKAVEHALGLEQLGASILDVGGESTRPGALPVSTQEELERVIPVIEGIRKHTTCAISVDTSKPEVMQAAINVGADMINDVRALQAPGALEAAAGLRVPVVMMHMQGQPKTMQDDPHYQDVVTEVEHFLQARVHACTQAGLSSSQLIIDPGFGFGKTVAHNFALLAQLSQLVQLGFPVLAGLSRKSMLGAATGKDDPQKRVSASVAACLIAAQAGAAIVRVHDVDETVDALKIWAAVQDKPESNVQRGSN